MIDGDCGTGFPRGLFVTGTDTGIGKTSVALGLMGALRASGRAVVGMKPIASGCIATEAGLRSEDAVALQAHASRSVPYGLVNPYRFAAPIAPHFAAASVANRITIATIEAAHRELAQSGEIVIVEGIGGWRVPINESEEMGDLARSLGHPILLVVGLRLGCINHALLTAESIDRAGLTLWAWVANQVDCDYASRDETITCLCEAIGAPLLGSIPWLPLPTAEQISSYLRGGIDALGSTDHRSCPM